MRERAHREGICAIYKDDFENLRRKHPEMDRILIALLAGELRRLNERLLEALYLPVEKQRPAPAARARTNLRQRRGHRRGAVDAGGTGRVRRSGARNGQPASYAKSKNAAPSNSDAGRRNSSTSQRSRSVPADHYLTRQVLVRVGEHRPLRRPRPRRPANAHLPATRRRTPAAAHRRPPRAATGDALRATRGRGSPVSPVSPTASSGRAATGATAGLRPVCDRRPAESACSFTEENASRPERPVKPGVRPSSRARGLAGALRCRP